MRIGLVSSAVPLTGGGGRFIADWLVDGMRERGHRAEIVRLPSTDDPETLFQQMTAYRLLHLSDDFDRVVTFRPPAHMVRHPVKIVWFIHHVRGFYDLWDSPYRPVPVTAYWQAFRQRLFEADGAALGEARKVFANSRVVAGRLRRFNQIEAEVLYPPLHRPERFRAEAWGDEIVCISRVEPHKRQHLLIEAMRHVRTPVRLRLCGSSNSAAYARELAQAVAAQGLDDRVVLDNRWIGEAEKIELLAHALASAYLPLDEDSYGYPTLEAAHARKATITTADAGGLLEFVVDGENGMVTEPEPRAVAEAFDRLWSDRGLARRMGEAAEARVDALGIGWDRVLDRLLA
jgi:glycosyltransferase involved in cell wall biosynthesis